MHREDRKREETESKYGNKEDKNIRDPEEEERESKER